MKVAFAYDSAFPWFNGGIERRRYNIMREFVRTGYEVHCFTMYREGMPSSEFKRDGIQYHCCASALPESDMYVNGKRNIFWAMKYAISLPFKMFGYRFGMVDADAFPFLHLFPIYLYSKLTGARLLTTWHEVWSKEYWADYLGPVKGRIGYAIEGICARMPKAFIVNSQSTKEELKRTFGIRKGVYVLPAAIDEQEIRKIQRRAKKGRTDYFVTVGRLIPEKNIGFAIESMKNVDARLLVIGAGPEKKKLQDKASESGAGDKIKFESGLPDAELFSKIYASLGLILVSKREGLSLISAEAISLGVPVIISDQTMLPEEVRRFCISIKHGSFTEGLRKMAMEAKQRRKEANRKSGAAIRLFSSKRAMPVYNKLLSG